MNVPTRARRCNKRVVATKSLTIHAAPMVLTVHFKRFTVTGLKIKDTVRYPERLQLGPHMSDVSGAEGFLPARALSC